MSIDRTLLLGEGSGAQQPHTATVSSVGISMPSLFNVSGSPVTTAGTLAVTLNTVAKNLVFAGPATGVDAIPTMRALVALDLGAGTADATTFLRGDLTWANVAASPAGADHQVQFNDAGSFGASSVFLFDGSKAAIGSPIHATAMLKVVSLETGGYAPAIQGLNDATSGAGVGGYFGSKRGYGIVIFNTDTGNTQGALLAYSSTNIATAPAIHINRQASTANTDLPARS